MDDIIDRMTGHLDIVCALDARGSSHLKKQSFRAPIHLSKPHLEEGILVVNVVNPTAGLFAGDRVTSRVLVEAEGRLLLTAPSATRVHRTNGDFAQITQDLSVLPGGFLECWPELFIPHGGARFRQQTSIRVDLGGELLFFEGIAPGRVAFGEAFAYESLEWETELFVNGSLTARERWEMTPGARNVQAVRDHFPTAYLGSCFVVSPRLTGDSECWHEIHRLHDPHSWVGCSRLAADGWVVKLLAANSIRLRRKLSAVRAILYAALGMKQPGFRRVTGVG